MRFFTKNAIRSAILIGLMAAAAQLASAQALNSTAQPITLNATLSESLTVGLSATNVNFPLTAGAAANPGSVNVTATTTWVMKPSRTAVKVYAYFASAAAALTDGGGNNIPSSAFFIADNAGPSTALTAANPFNAALASLTLANVAITNANRSANRTDVMAFNINLTTLPQLPAGSYTGTLNIQAQATP